jgi:hypothetical protein
MQKLSTILALVVCIVPLTGRAAPEPMPGCSYEYGGLSVTYMTRAGSPVLFHMFDCNGMFVRRYIDFTGAEVMEDDLLPSERHRTIDFLEDTLGIDITDPTDDGLEDLAIERGLI